MALTRTEFIDLLRERGYRLSDVARRWGLSRGRLTQIANDEQRPAHYEDAAHGLPRRGRGVTKGAANGRTLRDRRALAASGWVVGAEFVVSEEQGQHLPEGLQGVITSVSRRGTEWWACIEFQNGYRETFMSSYLRSGGSFLVETGRVVDVVSLRE